MVGGISLIVLNTKEGRTVFTIQGKQKFYFFLIVIKEENETPPVLQDRRRKGSKFPGWNPRERGTGLSVSSESAIAEQPSIRTTWTQAKVTGTGCSHSLSFLINPATWDFCSILTRGKASENIAGHVVCPMGEGQRSKGGNILPGRGKHYCKQSRQAQRTEVCRS